MNTAQHKEYSQLTTVAARAEWLLRIALGPNGMTVEPDIEGKSLSLRWRVTIAGVILPERYDCPTAAEASEKALEWLRSKTQAA